MVAAIAFSGGTPLTVQPNTGLKVLFDGVPQTWNDTTPQPLNWGNPAPLMSYTKNVSVTNYGNQDVTLILKTTEPQGSHLSWPRNNTLLPANYSTNGFLTLTTDSLMAQGSYTWLLAGSNGTITPTPTPTVAPTATSTPTPTATPTPTVTVTIDTTGLGLANISISKNNEAPFTLLPSDLPATFTCISTDILTLQAYPTAGYSWNKWVYGDGSFPSTINPITITNVNATLSATFVLTG